MLLLDSAERNDVEHHWSVYYSCNTKPSRVTRIVPLLPDYIRQLLTNNQLHTQLLSIIDISISVTSTTNAIAKCTLERRSLLDNPLICWSTEITIDHFTQKNSSSSIGSILAYNLLNNPIVKNYMTLAERPHKKQGLCILSPAVITNIIEKQSEDNPFQLMTEAEKHCQFSLLQNLAEPSRRRAYSVKDVHEFASIQVRNTKGLVQRTATFKYNGLPSVNTAVKDITLKSAVFPYLFPFGHGNYKGEVGFSDYIRMRIGMLFSVYTLYKPYLLLMYQLKQAIMIENTTDSTMLQRDKDAFKRNNKTTSDLDAMRNIARYNLPTSMPGTPAWHQKNLKDLIAIVDMWGLPDLFLTFTTDEVTETRWEEITTIENIAREFNQNFTWIDCPVECAVLFHS